MHGLGQSARDSEGRPVTVGRLKNISSRESATALPRTGRTCESEDRVPVRALHICVGGAAAMEGTSGARSP